MGGTSVLASENAVYEEPPCGSTTKRSENVYEVPQWGHSDKEDSCEDDNVYEKVEKAVYEELPCGSTTSERESAVYEEPPCSGGETTEKENAYQVPQWSNRNSNMEDPSKDNEYDIIEMHDKSKISTSKSP